MTSKWFCSLTVSPNASATAAGRWRAESGVRACIHKIATGDSDLIKVRFAPLCRLKSVPGGDITRARAVIKVAPDA